MKKSKEPDDKKKYCIIQSVTNLSIQVGWGASTFVVQTSYLNLVYNLNNKYKKTIASVS